MKPLEAFGLIVLVLALALLIPALGCTPPTVVHLELMPPAVEIASPWLAPETPIECSVYGERESVQVTCEIDR